MLGREQMDNIKNLIDAGLHTAKNNAVTAETCGLDANEIGLTYKDFIKQMIELRRYIDDKIANAEFLNGYICEYGEGSDDYCIYCGKDGRS